METTLHCVGRDLKRRLSISIIHYLCRFCFRRHDVKASIIFLSCHEVVKTLPADGFTSSFHFVDAVLVSDVIHYHHLCVVIATLTAVPDSVAQVDDHTCNMSQSAVTTHNKVVGLIQMKSSYIAIQASQYTVNTINELEQCIT